MSDKVSKLKAMFESKPVESPKRTEEPNVISSSLTERRVALESSFQKVDTSNNSDIVMGRASGKVSDLGQKLNLDHILRSGPPPKFNKSVEQSEDDRIEECDRRSQLPKFVILLHQSIYRSNLVVNHEELKAVNLKKTDVVLSNPDSRKSSINSEHITNALLEAKSGLKKAGDLGPAYR